MGSTLENQTLEKFRDLPALSAIEGFLVQHSPHALIKRKDESTKFYSNYYLLVFP
tara:strand:- start:499 stop:663 length:165 start_codon:yes stop_codon:yes gene_type:complete